MHWKVFICVLFTGITSDSSKPRLIFFLSYLIKLLYMARKSLLITLCSVICREVQSNNVDLITDYYYYFIINGDIL